MKIVYVLVITTKTFLMCITIFLLISVSTCIDINTSAKTNSFYADFGPYNATFNYNSTNYLLLPEYNEVDRPLSEYLEDPIVGWEKSGIYGIWILNVSTMDNIGYIDMYTESDIYRETQKEYLESHRHKTSKIYVSDNYTWIVDKVPMINYYARAWYSENQEISVGTNLEYPELFIEILKSLNVTQQYQSDIIIVSKPQEDSL